MINPLTKDECIYASGLIGHDFGNVMNNLGSFLMLVDLSMKKDSYKIKERELYDANSNFKKLNSLRVTNKLLSDYGAKREMEIINQEKLLGNLDDLFYLLDSQDVNYQKNFNINDFVGNPYVISSIYVNLIKNAFKVTKGKGNLKFNGNMYYGDLSDLFYRSEGTRTDGAFVKLSMIDDGPGFNSEIPYSDYFKVELPRPKSGGFGLTFCALACKYMGMHMKIDSVPGNTEVAIYKRVKMEGCRMK